MISEHDKQFFLCERLQRLGFTSKRRVKLYGEEFELISDPIPSESGFIVECISRQTGSRRRVGIPLTLLRTLEHELHSIEQEEALAA